MTPEEFERYGYTDRLTQEQFFVLDAERANAKRKGKGKVKGKESQVKVMTPAILCGTSRSKPSIIPLDPCLSLTRLLENLLGLLKSVT